MGKPQDHTIVFTGAGEREIQDRGRYFRVLDAPVADIFLQFDGSGEIQRGAGAQIADADGFKRVRVRSTVAQTVRVSVSDQPQEDNRQDVAVTATATVQGATVITAVPLVEVAALSTVQLAAGDADRIELRLALASDEPGPVWIGPAGVGDEEGGLLEPGMVDYPATTAAVFAYNPHATLSVFVSVLDMTAP